MSDDTDDDVIPENPDDHDEGDDETNDCLRSRRVALAGRPRFRLTRRASPSASVGPPTARPDRAGRRQRHRLVQAADGAVRRLSLRVRWSSHPAAAQADAFHRAVGGDITIPCMLDWETDSDDNCHPGRPQIATWDDVLAVAAAIRYLGHKVALLYTGNWYWSKMGNPTLAGHGFDLVNAKYGTNAVGTPAERYAAQGGDSGEGWNAVRRTHPGAVAVRRQDHLGQQAARHERLPRRPQGARTTGSRRGQEATMADVRYPYGWSGGKLTMAQLEAKATIGNAAPRVLAAHQSNAQEGAGRLGVGCIWRSSDVQTTRSGTGMARPTPVAAVPRCPATGPTPGPRCATPQELSRVDVSRRRRGGQTWSVDARLDAFAVEATYGLQAFCVPSTTVQGRTSRGTSSSPSCRTR